MMASLYGGWLDPVYITTDAELQTLFTFIIADRIGKTEECHLPASHR